MNWQAISFDWNQVRAFLATAEEGSLSAAARALGQTQPTVSRQVAALEEDLGVTLFERAGRAMALTEAGRDLMEHVRIMADAATKVSLVASGQSQTVEGKVVITATGAMATYYLPPIIRRIRDEAPGITLDIVTSNEVQDLTRREADISIRHARPTQPDLIAKLVGDSAAHLYASEDYIKSLGPIQTLKDIEHADFIGFDRNDELIAEMARHGLNLTPDNFTVNARAGTGMRELVVQGLGIGFLTRDVEKMEPHIKAILPDKITLPVPVWLVTHRELHTSKRIRVVYDILSEDLPNSGMV